MDEVPGSQPSLNTNSATRNVADANSGTEVVRTETKEMPRSSPDPSRIPDSTPSRSDKGIMIANTQSARMPVLAKRSQSSVLTDRKSTRLNSSHANISYAVFCLKKKTN